MSNFIIRKASKQAKKLRVLFSASAGSGKTYGALKTAYGLCGDWNKICVIDTERDSASLYADLGEFNTLNLSAPYSPERYIEAIKTCEEAEMEVIVIDSITHEWAGQGGALEIHAKLGGTFQDWGKVTPRHNNFVDAILTSKCHVFCTVRRKEEYAMAQNSAGRMQVQKMGMQEVTRDGFNYEMDLVFEISNDNHLAKASKDRTNIFVNEPEFLITEDTGKKLKDWATKGRQPIDDALDLIRRADTLETLYNVKMSFEDLHNNVDFTDALKAAKERIKEVVSN
jgi:AAA domain